MAQYRSRAFACNCATTGSMTRPHSQSSHAILLLLSADGLVVANCRIPSPILFATAPGTPAKREATRPDIVPGSRHAFHGAPKRWGRRKACTRPSRRFRCDHSSWLPMMSRVCSQNSSTTWAGHTLALTHILSACCKTLPRA